MGTGTAAMTLSDLLTALLSVVTQIFGTGLGTVGSAILSNILFQLVAGVSMGFIIVVVFKKLVHVF